MISVKRVILTWLTKEERLQKHSFLRRFFWKRGRIYRDMEQRAARMRQKEVITVAFMVLNLSCWKCDSVFRLMQQHPRFRPIIWIVPELQIKDADELQRNLEQMRVYFAERGYPVADLYSLEQMREEFAPDIVFLSKPYIGTTPWDAWQMDRELVCYVPYCFQNDLKEGFLYGQESQIWRIFHATPYIKHLAGSWMSNGGCNIRVVGSPMADELTISNSADMPTVWRRCDERKKRIIWAPHWSIGNISWFNVSTFLQVAEGMLHLAAKYADRVQWAFKPHPLLRDTLYKHPEWGKERTDAYYERWATMPNSQLEIGDYEALFKQSDAMIHDSGSFITEYLLVNKPCMYLMVENGFSNFNTDACQALNCYRKGASVDDVEQFVLDLLGNKPDQFAHLRDRFIKKRVSEPGKQIAARKIIDAVLNGR